MSELSSATNARLRAKQCHTRQGGKGNSLALYTQAPGYVDAASRRTEEVATQPQVRRSPRLTSRLSQLVNSDEHPLQVSFQLSLGSHDRGGKKNLAQNPSHSREKNVSLSKQENVSRPREKTSRVTKARGRTTPRQTRSQAHKKAAAHSGVTTDLLSGEAGSISPVNASKSGQSGPVGIEDGTHAQTSQQKG